MYGIHLIHLINQVHFTGTAQLMCFKIISGVKELSYYSCSFIGPTVNPKIPRVKKRVKKCSCISKKLDIKLGKINSTVRGVEI